MWLSDISPLRAGTVGLLSDNNLAEINVPIFASSVNRFLTFSSKRTIFGVFYSFLVHNYVISTKNKLPLAVYFPVSYTEIGAGISRKKSKSLSKATILRSFLIVCNLLSCPTMPSQAPKVSASRAKGNDRRRSGRQKKGGRPAVFSRPNQKARNFCSDIRTQVSIQPDIRTRPVFSGFLCGTHRNTFVVFPTWSECLSEALYIPIYKERK